MKRSIEPSETTPTSYQSFVNRAYERTKSLKGNCSRHHAAKGNMIRRGVHLGCCGGTSPLCKFDDIDWLLSEVKALAYENDQLKKHKSKKVADATNNQSAIHNNFVINNFIFGDSAIAKIAECAPQILQNAWKGKSLMVSAVEALNNAPPSPEKEQLLALKNSPEVVDNLNFKRQVVEILEEQVDKLPVELQAETKAKLAKNHDEIDAEAEKAGLSLI